MRYYTLNKLFLRCERNKEDDDGPPPPHGANGPGHKGHGGGALWEGEEHGEVGRAMGSVGLGYSR